MIHLITYGNHNYTGSKQLLYDEANATGWFDTITLYGPEDLDDEFREKYKDILQLSRGGGYWIWKPYIIKKHLNQINDNDILIFLDAGFCINSYGKQRFNEYIEMLNQSNEGCISFQMNNILLLEKYWTIKEIFQYFNIEEDGEIANTGQIISGLEIIKKNPNSINLINLWCKAVEDNPLLFTDYYNETQPHSYFKENRHDQSVFSIIRKMHNPILINDETYFQPFGNDESFKCPFWAIRRRIGI